MADPTPDSPSQGFFDQDPNSPDYQVNPLSKLLYGAADLVRPGSEMDQFSGRSFPESGFGRAVVPTMLEGAGNTLEGLRHLVHYMRSPPQVTEDNPSGQLPIQDVLALTGAGMGTGSLLGPEAGAGTAGMFLGPKAVGWDYNKLGQANIMLQQLGDTAATRNRIWNTTGLFRGADRQWRSELSDVGASIDPMAAAHVASVDDLPLGEVLKHPELFRAYPFLKDVNVRTLTFPEEADGYQGLYTSRANQGKGELAAPEDMLDVNHPDLLNTILHESMHGIQHFQDWNVGGVPTLELKNGLIDAYIRQGQALRALGDMAGFNYQMASVAKINKLTPEQIYDRLAGENETGNVEYRNDIRLLGGPLKSPVLTERFPRKDQIMVRGALGGSSPLMAVEHNPFQHTLVPVDSDPFQGQ